MTTPKQPITINDLLTLLKETANKPVKKEWLVKVRNQEEFDAVQKLLKTIRGKINIRKKGKRKNGTAATY